MAILFSFYDYILGEKILTATTKKDPEPKPYTLQIITPARRFLFLPFGGGFVKLSRLYDMQGNYIHPRYYSDELKQEVKEYKKRFKIPYFKLWRGMLILFGIILIAAGVMAIKQKIESNKYNGQVKNMVESLNQIQPGQVYGASFFTSETGNSLPTLADGWVKVLKIEGDTLFVQRSIQLDATNPVFNMEKLAVIKPKTDADWQPVIEKMNLKLLKEQLNNTDVKRVDVQYIGKQHDKYNGVIFTIKGRE